MGPAVSRVALWTRPYSLLFLLLLALHVLPIWLVRNFPSQDGPSHVYNARTLWQYLASDHGRIHEYYEINPKPDPTWFGHLVLVALLAVVRDPPLAERLLLTGYLVLLPLTARRALLAMGSGGEDAAFLVFPLLCSFAFHTGLLTFSYSLVVFFWFLSAFIRQYPDCDARRIRSLTLIALLLFLCHVVAFALAAIACVILILVRSVGRRRLSSPRTWLPLLAFAPGTIWVLILIPLHVKASIEPRPGWDLGIFAERLWGLVSFRREELSFYQALAGLVLLLAAAAAWRKLRGEPATPWDAFFAVWAFFLALLWKTPAHVGSIWLLPERLVLFCFFGAVLWLGAQRLGRGSRALCATASVVISLALLNLHAQVYADFDELLSEYGMATRYIPDNSAVLPLTFALRGPGPGGGALSERVAPMMHAAARIGWTRTIADLANYEARMRIFPLRFREGLDPWVQIGFLESLPAHLDFLTYSARTGRAIDYVVVWGLTLDQIEASEDTRAIVAQLEEGFLLVYRSPQRGLLRVYRSRGERGQPANP